jgi:phosphoesterase RecJ-like protein
MHDVRMHPVAKLIQDSQDIILSTHTQPDGDGLGCQFALYWALKKAGKNPRVINLEPIPKKYLFLDPHQVVELPQSLKSPIKGDLVLIFDTNDPELLLDLWPKFNTGARNVCFVDHHVALERFPIDEKKNLINVNASSTGEIVFDLIKALEIPLDAQIAGPLYTSILFDTNYFKYIRASPTPHLLAAELLRYPIEPEKIHRALFGNHSTVKLKYLAQVLGKIDYEFDGRLACVRVHKQDLDKLGLEAEETKDIIDLVMDVESIEAAVLFREEADNQFKISFRSKGAFSVSHLAQSLGGGGHKFASGATIQSSYPQIKAQILTAFEKLFAK